jgi:hypothetical protein
MAAWIRRTHQVKGSRVACWNADGILCRNMELDRFFGQHHVNVCLSTETKLRSGEDFQMAIHVCPHTSRLTERGGTVIVVRQGMDHYLVFPSHPIYFLLEGISDLGNFPLKRVWI